MPNEAFEILSPSLLASAVSKPVDALSYAQLYMNSKDTVKFD